MEEPKWLKIKVEWNKNTDNGNVTTITTTKCTKIFVCWKKKAITVLSMTTPPGGLQGPVIYIKFALRLAWYCVWFYFFFYYYLYDVCVLIFYGQIYIADIYMLLNSVLISDRPTITWNVIVWQFTYKMK